MASSKHRARFARGVDARSEALQVTDPISKDLAAYQLGYCRSYSWMWGESLWLNPEEQLARDNAQSGLCLVRRALIDLADRLEPRILHDLHRRLDELTGMTRVWEWLRGPEGIDPAYSMSEHAWRGLLEPATRGLDGTSIQGLWCNLGGAIGQYQNELHALPFPGQMEPVDLDAWPDIGPIIRVAQDLPVTGLRRLPLLSSLVRLASQRGQSNQAVLLGRFLDVNLSSWSYRPGHVDFITMIFVLITIDHQIRSRLKIFARDPGLATGALLIKPDWDRRHRELRYRGDLVRPAFRADAENAIVILNCFQDNQPSWPRKLDDPLPGPTDSPGDRLKEAIATLNRNLVVLRFHEDGECEGIIWDLDGLQQ